MKIKSISIPACEQTFSIKYFQKHTLPRLNYKHVCLQLTLKYDQTSEDLNINLNMHTKLNLQFNTFEQCLQFIENVTLNTMYSDHEIQNMYIYFQTGPFINGNTILITKLNPQNKGVKNESK